MKRAERKERKKEGKMNIDEIMKKYGRKIEQEVNLKRDFVQDRDFSREFMQFKSDMMPSLSRYEKWCQSLGNIIKLRISPKDEIKIGRQLEIAHLDVSPSQAVGLGLTAFFISFLTALLISVAVFLITNSFPILFLFLLLLSSFFLFYYVYSMPYRLANRWRLKASSQMVPAILYIVIYMKHTSNLERAVRFASEHLHPPLALDFRKIFWDVEVGKHSTIKDSLESYLETWRDYSIEFIESFHLIESSLYEPSESRRVQVLERALKVILDGVYDKMLKYNHSVKSPLTNLYMLGIVLPTLGLALLPLASTLLQGYIQWYHVFILFNLIIPFFVFYLTTEIMLKRPGGYGEESILEMNPLYHKYTSRKPYLIALLVCLPLFIVGTLPLLFQIPGLAAGIGLQSDYTFGEFGINFLKDVKFFDFQIVDGGMVGPFGPVALLLSLFIPFSIFMFFSLAYSMKTRELIEARDSSKALELEFTNSLFQLGNRIGDGMPAELAFTKIAESTKGQVTESFFNTVNTNIRSLGMNLENAIFNPKRGAIVYYPSVLIATSMRILIESSKKGLAVAAASLMAISEYIKNIHKINQRLGDLLADIVSDMKSNMVFLAPLLSGIVVGLAAMITMILSKLRLLFELGFGDLDMAGLASVSTLTGLFDVTKMIPPYYLQISIGIYIVQIVFILTGTLVTVSAGEDKLKKTFDTARNMRFAGALYLITALFAIVALSILAAVALSGLQV